MPITANAVTSSAPQLSCVNDNPSMSVYQNQGFNITMSVVNSLNQMQIPNIAWTVYNILYFIYLIIKNKFVSIYRIIHGKQKY